MSLPKMEPSNPWSRAMGLIAGLRKDVNEFKSAIGTLASATISKGLLTIQEGGGVLVKDGGDITIQDGGDVRVTDGGNVVVDDGGDVILNDGGTLTAYDGTIRTYDQGTGSGAAFEKSILYFSPDYENDGISYGRIMVDPGSTYRALRILPPYSSGGGGENAITVIGRGGTQDARVVIEGDTIDMMTNGRLRLYELDPGSPDYSLGLNIVDGSPIVVLDTSSARYKQDDKPSGIDPDVVLQIEDVIYRNIADVEANGDAAKFNLGVIAEQIHDIGLGDLLVTYNADGQPDAVKYQLIGVTLLPVVKRQQKQLDEQAQQIAALIDANAALATRLDTLEGKS